MPTYVYSDGKHQREVTLTIGQVLAGHEVRCTYPKCRRLMHRVPQIVPVNWNGLPPHLEGTRSPVVQKFIDNTPERRARYLDTERKK